MNRSNPPQYRPRRKTPIVREGMCLNCDGSGRHTRQEWVASPYYSLAVDKLIHVDTCSVCDGSGSDKWVDRGKKGK